MLFHLAEPSALLGIVVALVVGLIAHNAAQIGAARLAHDPNGSWAKRPRPGQDSDWAFSVVAMVIVGVGWAQPVEINTWRRQRRYRNAAVLAAGPLAYLVLATASLGLLRLTDRFASVFMGDRVAEVGGGQVFAAKLLVWMAVTFASLFILSLVPVPPLDGGRILFLLAPDAPNSAWTSVHRRLTNQPHIGIAIILAILLLPIVLSGFPSVIGQLVGPLLRGLSHLVGLSLG